MFKPRKIKAVILVFQDEMYVTKNKYGCDLISGRFPPPSIIWKQVRGIRPWKAIDRLLDGK